MWKKYQIQEKLEVVEKVGKREKVEELKKIGKKQKTKTGKSTKRFGMNVLQYR